MKKFELIEHTADVGLKIYGQDLVDLFINAAYGMCSLLWNINEVRNKQQIKIMVKAQSKEELLVSWLNEILYHYQAKKFLFHNIEIKEFAINHLQAELSGEEYDRNRHQLKLEIKAATYHNVKIEKREIELGGPLVWQTQVIFDV